MDKIASFNVDHNKLEIGMYISRIDGDIITYDIRMVKPNNGYFLSTGSIHSIEHLFATFARNSFMSKDVIYVGPMGCRTGFYLLIRGEQHDNAIKLVRDAFEFISTYNGELPGNTAAECGNYKDHDLEAAKKDVLPILKKLQNYNKENLQY